MTQTAAVGLFQREGLRQFIKFCVIGLSGLIIDAGISGVLTYKLHWVWFVAKTVSFLIAVTNGYIWNSLWTFRGQGGGRSHAQYARFVAVSIVGYLLNLAIMKTVFLAFTGQLIHHGEPDFMHWCLATGIAAVIVSGWNFLANRKWTFSD